MITAAYYMILTIFFTAGFLLLRESECRRIFAFNERIIGLLQNDKCLRSRFSGTVFKDTAFMIDRKQYEIFRLSMLAAAAAAGIATGESTFLTVSIFVYAVTEPVEKAGRFITPFGRICMMLKKHAMHKMDEEIFEAIAFLKNIAASGKYGQAGSDHIIEQLAGCADLLKPIYFKMLNLLRINRKEEAIEYFALETGTRSGRDFGRLLMQLDEISPRELEETLLSYQKSIREVKITRQKQQDETVSDLLYLPVVMNVLLIFINFIYVSYFIEQKNMFGVLIN